MYICVYVYGEGIVFEMRKLIFQPAALQSTLTFRGMCARVNRHVTCERQHSMCSRLTSSTHTSSVICCARMPCASNA